MGKKIYIIHRLESTDNHIWPKGDVSKLTAVRLQRWAIRLMGYNFEICYKEGRANSNADTLSRFPIFNGGEYATRNAIYEETTVQTESDMRGQLMFILTDFPRNCVTNNNLENSLQVTLFFRQ